MCKGSYECFVFLLVLCSPTHHEVQLMLGINQVGGGNPYALAETEIQYQYNAKCMILSLSQILVLITQQSKSSQKSYLAAQLTLNPRLLARM